MKVKRYIVEDMNEAMIKIKNELGIDAVILNTRRLKKSGFFNFFKKPLIEVVAAVDDQPSQQETLKRATRAVENEKVASTEKKYEENAVLSVESRASAASTSTPFHSDKNDFVKNDSTTNDSMKNESLKTMTEQVSNPNGELAELKKMMSHLMAKVDSFEHMIPQQEIKTEDKYIELLKNLGIQESISKKIIEILQRQININDQNHDAVMNAIKVIAREYLGDVKTIDTDPKKGPNIYMFLGPTGVGKTTTLAKIAARLSLVENKKVGLITADTYRIAAVEQLKTYSEILGIPLEVIYEANELKEALEHFKDKDYVLIDTAGRSHKSKELKSDYDEIVSFLDDVKVYLVLSMTTSLKDLKSIIESYSFLSEYRLLFTKLDEATSYGNILNMKVLTGKSLSYFTMGQSVPDDIEVADKEKILKYIFDQNI